MSMDLGPYAGFVVAAYVSALGIVVALIAWIMLDPTRSRECWQDLGLALTHMPES